MLPTLALIKSEKVDDYVVGFQEFGNKDDFETEVLEQRLAKGEVIDYTWPVAQAKQMVQKSVRKGFSKTESDEDSDFD